MPHSSHSVLLPLMVEKSTDIPAHILCPKRGKNYFRKLSSPLARLWKMDFITISPTIFHSPQKIWKKLRPELEKSSNAIYQSREPNFPSRRRLSSSKRAEKLTRSS